MSLTIRMILTAVIAILFLWFAIRKIDAYYVRQDWGSRWAKTGKIVLQYGLVLIVLLLLIPASAIERRIIFVPLDEPAANWRQNGLPISLQDVYIPMPSGEKIHGWYLEPNLPKGQRPDYYILYFHGNGGNLTYYTGELIGMVQCLNAAVLSIDYSGYGQSGGAPSEKQLYRDGLAAMDQFQKITGKKPSEIIVTGMSLGGAIAADVALKMQKAGAPVRALILECTFSSIPRMARELIPVLPADWLLLTRFDTNRKLREYRGPLLISHGDADRVVSFSHARWNDEAAKTVRNRRGPYVFITIPGGPHAGYFSESYFAQVEAFLKTVPNETAEPQQP